MAVLHVQPKAFWRQFDLAIKQRESVIFDSAPAAAVPNAGDHLQSIGDGSWYYRLLVLQQWIEDNCDHFIRSHDDAGDPYDPATVFEGVADSSAVVMWSWATLKTAALGGDEWTAYTSATTHTHRKIQTGDHWNRILWDELARCLDMLIWTKQVLCETFSHFGVSGSYGDFTDAKSAAVADFAAASDGTDYVGTYKELVVYTGLGYGAEISAGHFHIQAEAKAVAMVGCTAYAYIHTEATENGTWNAQGETNIVQDEYHMAGSGAVAIGTQPTIVAFGTLAEPPTWPAEPPLDEFYVTGWQLDDYFSLCVWAFTILSPIT